MKRLVGAVAVAVGISIALAGCDEYVSSASSTTAAEPEETWAPPTDGVWPGRANPPLIGFQEPFIQDRAYQPNYELQVTGLPEFSELDGDDVTMSQEFRVTRIGDDEKYNDFFPTLHAGIDETGEGFYTENAEAVVECDGIMPNVGDSITCVISGQMQTDHIENSYWSLSDNDFAAWPSQETVEKNY